MATTLLTFKPLHQEPPSSNPARWGWRNQHPCLKFHPTTNQSAVFSAVMPQCYSGGGVTVYIHYAMATAVAGTVDWDVAFELMGDQDLDIDGDGFAASNSVNGTSVPSTSGLVDVLTVSFTDGADMDSVQAGDGFRLKLTRDAASDTATGDAQVTEVEIRDLYISLVVGFGDSITVGDDASDSQHQWLDIVAATRGWNRQNSGIGATILQNTVQNSVSTIGAAADNNGRDTYTTRVTAYAPQYVLILYGLNDLKLNDAAITVANFQTDLGEVIDGLTGAGIAAGNIVIGSPPYCLDTYPGEAPWTAGSRAKHAQYVTACSTVATAKSTKYIDVFQWMADNGGDALVSGDGTHPNDDGHQAIANAFLSVI